MNNSLIRVKVEIFSTVTIQKQTEKTKERENRKRRKDQRIQHQLIGSPERRTSELGKRKIAKENM